MEFRRTTRADFPLLARWLGSPHVARFWNHETTPEAIERDFGGSIDGSEPSFDFIVEDAGVPVGFSSSGASFGTMRTSNMSSLNWLPLRGMR